MSNLIGCDAILVGGGGGGTPTVPDEFHYVASDVVESGGAVSQMNDQSGNDNHAVQSNGAYQPALTASNPTYNNQSTIFLDSDFFQFACGGIRVHVKTGFYFMWCGNIVAGSSNEIFGSFDSLNNRISLFDNLNQFRIYYKDSISSSVDISTTTTEFDSPAVWVMVSNGTTTTVYRNGISKASLTNATKNTVFGQLGANGILIRSDFVFAEMKLRNEYSLAKINADGAAMATAYGFTWTNIT